MSEEIQRHTRERRQIDAKIVNDFKDKLRLIDEINDVEQLHQLFVELNETISVIRHRGFSIDPYANEHLRKLEHHFKYINELIVKTNTQDTDLHELLLCQIKYAIKQIHRQFKYFIDGVAMGKKRKTSKKYKGKTRSKKFV